MTHALALGAGERTARALAALALVALLALVPSAAAVGPGDAAPDFALVDENGAVVRLSDFRGRPVVLNAWATWCPFCIDEIPLFQSAHDDLNDADRSDDAVSFLLVNLDEPQEPASTFLREDVGTSLTALYDPTDAQRGAHEGVDFADTRRLLTGTYRVRGMPTTFFIDADGVVQRVKIGPILSRAELGDLLAAIGVETTTSASGSAR